MTETQEALLLAVLDHPQHAETIVEWASEPGNLDSLADDDEPEPEPTRLAHAPAGGVTIGGKQFVGGQFIPGEVLDRATPQEKAAVEGKADKPDNPAPSIPGLSEDAQKPDNAGKVRRVVSLVTTAAKAAVGKLSAIASKHAPDVLLEAADFAKITFAGTGTGMDPVKGAVGISANDAALIASHVLGRAALWAKRKLTGNPEARLSHEDHGQPRTTTDNRQTWGRWPTCWLSCSRASARSSAARRRCRSGKMSWSSWPTGSGR